MGTEPLVPDADGVAIHPSCPSIFARVRRRPTLAHSAARLGASQQIYDRSQHYNAYGGTRGEIFKVGGHCGDIVAGESFAETAPIRNDTPSLAGGMFHQPSFHRPVDPESLGGHSSRSVMHTDQASNARESNLDDI
jgi:hypothetical protein